MNWLYFSLACLCFWTPTGIFLGKANGMHGFVMTFHVQAVIMVIFSFFLQFIQPPDLALVTKPSMAFSIANGICSGFAYVFFMKAFETAPGKVPEIEFVTALYPVLCVFLIFAIQQIRPNWVDEIVKIRFNHLFSTVLFAGAFASWFWQPEWTEKMKSFF